MVIDYASSVNQFTQLDAFPVPLITDVLDKLHGSKVFSRLDMKSAYYQVPLTEAEQPFTAFEAVGELWEFTRLPFGVTNGVPVFCRVMQDIVGNLPGVVNYFDDIVIYVVSQAEHDVNLSHFVKRALEVNLTLNIDKCSFSSTDLKFRGHTFIVTGKCHQIKADSLLC